MSLPPPGSVREAVSLTVEERLKTLLDTPGSVQSHRGVVNGGFELEDGELLQPPPPKPREGEDDVGDRSHYYLGRVTNPRPGDSEHSSYVPSKPSERMSAPRSQAILTRTVGSSPSQSTYSSQSSSQVPPPYRPQGGVGTGPSQQAPPPPRYQPPPQYSPHLRRSEQPPTGPTPQNGELRNACNKLYTHDPPTRSSYPNYSQAELHRSLTSGGAYSPGVVRHNVTGVQLRTSPMGQSQHSSSQSSQSPNSPPVPPRAPRSMPGSSTEHQGPTPHDQHVPKPQDRQRMPTPQEDRQRIPTPQERRVPTPHGSDQYDARQPMLRTGAEPGRTQTTENRVSGSISGHHERHGSLPSHERTGSHWNNHNPSRPDEIYGSGPGHSRASQYAPSQESIELQQLHSKSGGLKSDLVHHKVYDTVGTHRQNLNINQGPGAGWRDSVVSEDIQLSPPSSRSVTPPLPPLSPSNTPPITPPESPQMHHKQYLSPRDRVAPGYMNRTPDVVTSTNRKQSSVPGVKKKPKKSVPGTSKSRKSSPGKTPYRISPHKGHPYSKSMGALNDVQETPLDEDSADQETTTNAGSNTEDYEDDGGIDRQELVMVRRQLEGLELMYTEILKLLGVDNELTAGSRRSISSTSSISRTGRGSRLRRHHSNRHRARDIKQMNKRFTRLESHVVTLARSVAHLSSEMRSQNALFQEVEEMKLDIQRLKEERSAAAKAGKVPGSNNEWERFRGWVPMLTNPKRVKKLTKFFGQEPFLHLFLQKLGYEKYIPNFESEKIGMMELPYMNEERLQRIGIPLGPRLRILQESQLCFRQENFDIYIV